MPKLALHGGKPVRPHSRFLVFGAPPIGEEEIAGVVDSLRKRWIGTGPKVAQFEAAFAAYKGMPHAVAVNSCTAALHLAMLALDIGPGDEVLVPALTFCATANAVLHAGATPVPVDVLRESMNIDPADAERKITRRTKAIVPVHFAGRACDMRILKKLARAHRLRIIEDCAHAIESESHGIKAGTAGDLACFSFYATKNLTTGEGGMLLTRSSATAARLKRLALHGMSQDAWKRFSDAGYKHYDVVDLGYKYNLTDLAAAIGLPQLKAIEKNWLKRQAIWRRYQEAFADLQAEGQVQLPAEPGPNEKHAYHLYTPLIQPYQGKRGKKGKNPSSRRDFILSALTAEGIGIGVHYRSLSDHPLYQKRLKWKRSDAPVAADFGDRTVSLPLSPGLSEGDVHDVIRAFSKVVQNSGDL